MDFWFWGELYLQEKVLLPHVFLSEYFYVWNFCEVKQKSGSKGFPKTNGKHQENAKKKKS